MTESLRQITIYGLVSHYGTSRAKQCAKYLHKYLPQLYAKPKVRAYFDEDWIDFVKKLRDEVGDVHRRLWYLKHPVIVFFNDKYVGDHRVLVEYIVKEHGVVPDMPYPNLFPDFTRFLPTSKNKDYVYFDVRVGDLDDYVVGKMVFELHTDICPQTCKFFKFLCEPFGDLQFHRQEKEFKFSYLGSTIRRICGKSFVQGGSISNTSLLRVKDENYRIKHNRRGVISIANQGNNLSTTEFVIDLKPNLWMDRKNVAFGRLIFGEPILTAIESVPTHYQSPVKEIVIVGCGVIPRHDERINFEFQEKIIKEKERIITDVKKMKEERIKRACAFEQKLMKYLEESQLERNIEFKYTEDIPSENEESNNKQLWLEPWIEDAGENLEEEQALEGREGYELEEEYKLLDESFGEEKSDSDFTAAKILEKHRKKDSVEKRKMVVSFIQSVLDRVFTQDPNDVTQLDDILVEDVKDVIDSRDVSSTELKFERYEEGLYSMPESLRKTLVDVYNKLTPSQLKLIGLETRDLLKEGGAKEETLNLWGSEDIISGIVMAVLNSKIIEMTRLMTNSDSGVTLELQLDELVDEVTKDVISLMKSKGPDFIKSLIAERDSEPSIVEPDPPESVISTEIIGEE